MSEGVELRGSEEFAGGRFCLWNGFFRSSNAFSVKPQASIAKRMGDSREHVDPPSGSSGAVFSSFSTFGENSEDPNVILSLAECDLLPYGNGNGSGWLGVVLVVVWVFWFLGRAMEHHKPTLIHLEQFQPEFRAVSKP